MGRFTRCSHPLGQNSKSRVERLIKGLSIRWQPGAGVPDANGLIPAGGNEKLSPRVDGDATDSMVVACQGHDLLAAKDTPEFDRFIATSGNDTFAVW